MFKSVCGVIALFGISFVVNGEFSNNLCTDETKEILGDGWELVRRVDSKKGRWHEATDNLVGTDAYGNVDYCGGLPDIADCSFSVHFAHREFNLFLLMGGDCQSWLIAPADQVNGDYYDNQARRTCSSSKKGDNSDYVKWYNREHNLEDPWVSVVDHSQASEDGARAGYIVYGEDSINWWNQKGLPVHGGANVYIKLDNDVDVYGCPRNTPVPSPSPPTGPSAPSAPTNPSTPTTPPPSPPTSNPACQECCETCCDSTDDTDGGDCKNKDILFLLDESESMESVDGGFGMVQDFTKKLMGWIDAMIYDSAKLPRYGIMTFDNSVREVYDLGQSQLRYLIMGAISGITPNYGGQTNFELPIVQGAYVIGNETANTFNNAMVLITDGRQIRPDGNPCAIAGVTSNVNAYLRERHIRLVIVGIGDDFNSSQVSCLVDNPAHIIHISTFDATTMANEIGSAVAGICNTEENTFHKEKKTMGKDRRQTKTELR